MQPIVRGPQDVCDAPQHTSTLLIIIPGAFLLPSDYSELSQALQHACASKVRLWVCVPPVDTDAVLQPVLTQGQYYALEHYDTAYSAAVQAAQEAGCPINTDARGCSENVFVCVHSLSCAAGPMLLRRVGGVIYMSGQIREMVKEGPPACTSLDTWGRPTMTISGMLDGTARPASFLPTLVDAVGMMQSFGARYVASRKPVILLPGINHALFSNGQLRAHMGDIGCDTPLPTAAALIAQPISDFLVVHANPSDSVQCGVAVDSLMQHMATTICNMNPLSTAIGWGDLRGTYEGLASSRSNQTPSVDPPAIPAATYAEQLPYSNPVRQYIAHPGQLAAARQFTGSVQRRLLGDVLDTEAAGKLRIAVTVHTDPASFISAEPTVASVGGDVVLNVHCCLHRPSLTSPQQHLTRITRPMSPQYAIKLKSKVVVGTVLGLAEDSHLEGVAVSGSQLSADAYEAAVKLLPEDVRSRLTTVGKKLIFLPDRILPGDDGCTDVWLQEQHITFTTTADGDVQWLSSYEYGAGRLCGNHYIKCLSLGWMVEWGMTEALKDKEFHLT